MPTLLRRLCPVRWGGEEPQRGRRNGWHSLAVQVDAVPDANRELIDTWRAEPPPPICWPRQRWLNGLPEHAEKIGTLPMPSTGRPCAMLAKTRR